VHSINVTRAGGKHSFPPTPIDRIPTPKAFFASRLPAVVTSHGGASIRKTVLDVTVFKIFTAVFETITAAFNINTAVMKTNTTAVKANAAVFKTNTAVMALNAAVMKTNTVVFEANAVVFILNTVALTGIYHRPVSSAKVITC
jgi:hypothetical protein